MIPVLLMVILVAYTPSVLGQWVLMEFQLIMMKYVLPNLFQDMWKTIVIHYQKWCVYTVCVYIYSLPDMVCTSPGYTSVKNISLKY